MKLSLALIISTLTTTVGLIFSRSPILLPISIVLASIIDINTRDWVRSNKLGRQRTLSISLKIIFSLIGFYAMVGQLLCIWLLIKWFIF